MGKKRYKDLTPTERKEYDRDGHLRRKYGISLVEYNRMRKEQEYCCLICGRHEDDIRPTIRKGSNRRPPTPMLGGRWQEKGDSRGVVCA